MKMKRETIIGKCSRMIRSLCDRLRIYLTPVGTVHAGGLYVVVRERPVPRRQAPSGPFGS
jgi:hypothetical protein